MNIALVMLGIALFVFSFIRVFFTEYSIYDSGAIVIFLMGLSLVFSAICLRAINKKNVK